MLEDGKVVPREVLMTETIWYDQYMFDRTIDTHIKNIRKKIWDKDMIITVRGVWYRLNK
jgi:DNA-binding response OmpR family regulator